MKRYNCTLSDKRGAFGLCMEEHKEGMFVPFSEVGQLKQRIQQLLEERSRTGLDIDRAILCGKVPEKNGLKSRLELLANHHKREMELAAQLSDATRQCGVMAGLLREANDSVYFHLESPDSRLSGEEAGKLIALTESIADALAGKLPEQHSDDAAVDRFAAAMKVKLAAARAKGRGGWDDHAACSVEYLADLLVDHVGKGNCGTFEDVANFAMMLHQRGADPAVLAHSATMTTCSRCKGHGMIGGVTGQTPESMDFWEAECPDCSGRGKIKVEGRTITEGQELELITVLQSIVNGFSDDPAHDAAALLKRITGEVPWTGYSFQLPPRQGGEPCATEPPSSSPA